MRVIRISVHYGHDEGVHWENYSLITLTSDKVGEKGIRGESHWNLDKLIDELLHYMRMEERGELIEPSRPSVWRRLWRGLICIISCIGLKNGR